MNKILTVVDRDDGGNLFCNPRREGWMDKQGSNPWDSFKPRYFILNGSLLYYFRTEEDGESSIHPSIPLFIHPSLYSFIYHINVRLISIKWIQSAL